MTSASGIKLSSPKSWSTHFKDIIIAIAKLFIFNGSISPSKALGTGPTPSPYAKTVKITLMGNNIWLSSLKNSAS